MGSAFLQAPLMLVEADIVEGRLVEVLSDFRPPPLDVNLVFQAARWLPTQTRAFLDMAKDWQRSPIPSDEPFDWRRRTIDQ